MFKCSYSSLFYIPTKARAELGPTHLKLVYDNLFCNSMYKKTQDFLYSRPLGQLKQILSSANRDISIDFLKLIIFDNLFCISLSIDVAASYFPLISRYDLTINIRNDSQLQSRPTLKLQNYKLQLDWVKRPNFDFLRFGYGAPVCRFFRRSVR